MAATARTLFISDLHLDDSRPAIVAQFERFLATATSGAEAVYILGDLFEYWVGDDDLETPFHAVVAGFLRKLSEAGVGVHLMHGNRDFLMADAFCSAAGARLLPDPSVVEAGGARTLLMHGDTLCLDDTDYQAWRATARSERWQRDFLARPLAERRS